MSIDIPEQVAIKVIKNRPAYFEQGLVEIRLLERLMDDERRTDDFPIVQLFDHFIWNGQRCLVFELLSIDLLELYRSFPARQGIPIKMLRPMVKQILLALEILYEHNIIHCDIKPENILLVRNVHDESVKVKLIDFGSACYENGNLFSNIQTAYYRAPEVILGSPYDAAIDMWSLGCVIVELYTGFPLFPGKTDHEMLTLMKDILSDMPGT